MGDEAVWSGSMPAEYDAGLGDAKFRPCARSTAQRVAGLLPDGGDVLEVAAGTGIVTAELVRLPGARVTATDLNAGMVAYGRDRVPQATWQQADALALPYDDASYDVVVCQFGVMFFPDEQAGLAELRRVLRPGGAAVVTSWDAVEHTPEVVALLAALDEVFPQDPPLFVGRVPHGYCDPVRFRADLQRAGLTVAGLRTVVVTGTAASAGQLARGYCLGSPLRAELQARGDLAALHEAVAAAMTRRLGEGPVTGPQQFLEAVASR